MCSAATYSGRRAPRARERCSLRAEWAVQWQRRAMVRVWCGEMAPGGRDTKQRGGLRWAGREQSSRRSGIVYTHINHIAWQTIARAGYPSRRKVQGHVAEVFPVAPDSWTWRHGEETERGGREARYCYPSESGGPRVRGRPHHDVVREVRLKPRGAIRGEKSVAAGSIWRHLVFLGITSR